MWGMNGIYDDSMMMSVFFGGNMMVKLVWNWVN